MTIRPALATDAGAIDALFQEFVAYLRSIGDEHNYRFGAGQYLADGFGADRAFRGLVAEAESGVVGYTLFSPTYDGDYVRGLYIIDLYVREAFRSGGVGRLLLNAVQGVARAEGRTRVSWDVHTNNSSAIRFYEALGARSSTETTAMYLDLE